MTVPAAAKPLTSADLTMPIEGLGTAETVALDVAVTAGPVGGVPAAVAVLTTWPASTSAWVVVYVAEHVTDAPGASVVTPLQSTVDRPGRGSVRPTDVSVTLPGFVTT